MRIRTVVASAIVIGTLGVAGTAGAQTQTVSGSVGPIAVPNAPVQVCVNGTCQQTPALAGVGLQVTASADGAGLPTITPSSCSSGTGAALVVNGGSSTTTVSGTVSGTLPNGSAFSQPVGPVTVAPNGTTTLSACTTASTGLPVPVPPVPSPTGLIGIVLNLVQTLLGGLGGGGGLPLLGGLGGGLPL